MDISRFDRLIRSLSAGASRRAVVAALVALGLAAPFRDRLEAEARKRRKRNRATPNAFD